MSTQPKKYNILVMEAASSEGELDKFLKIPNMILTVVCWKPSTIENIKAAQSRFGKVFSIRMNDIIPSKFYEVAIFTSTQYERAVEFSTKNPDTRIFIIHDHSFEFEYEETDKLTVRSWQTISTYLKSLTGKKPNVVKPKPKKETSPTPIEPEPDPYAYHEEESDDSIVDESNSDF